MVKIKVYCLRSDISTIFIQSATFPAAGHTPLEQSDLPRENTTHTSYKFADSLSHSFTILVHLVIITPG